jgi:periplasmic protein TonB
MRMAQREFGTGARIAIGLAAAAPVIALLVAGALSAWLAATLAAPFVYKAAHGLLIAAALACSVVVCSAFWRDIRTCRLKPLQLLLIASLPCWLIGEAAGQYLALEALRRGHGGAAGHAEMSSLRLAGQFFAWSLTGSVCFGLAIAGFLWRQPGRRIPGLMLAWASLVPLVAFVVWLVVGGEVRSPQARGGLIGYALISLPIVLGIAGAAIGDSSEPHPRSDWLVAVPAGSLLVFAAIVSVMSGQALIETELALDSRGAAQSADPMRLYHLGLAGLVLAALPALAFAWRLALLPSARAWPLIALPALLAAGAITLGDGPLVKGMAQPYMQRIGWLVAFLVATPLVIWGLRRMLGRHHFNILANAFVVVSALVALQAVAMRPGLLVIAAHSARPEVAKPAVVAKPQPPRDAPHQPMREEGRDSVMPAPAFVPPPPAIRKEPLAPMTPVLVSPAALHANLTHSPAMQPPAELVKGRPRQTVIVKLQVDAGGKVTAASVVKSSGNPPLDEYVRKQLSQWTFRPWIVNGTAVPFESAVPVIFQPRT